MASKHSCQNDSFKDYLTETATETLPYLLEPHESYEGRHRWDPEASWSPDEEKRLVRKTDLMLLSWICIMVTIP